MGTRSRQHGTAAVRGLGMSPHAAADAGDASTEPELRISGLSVAFGGVQSVDRVHLRFGIGQLTGLIGPNGAGKSTLVDAITGYVRPSHGRVTFMGRDITGWAPARLAHAGIVRTFQHLELFDDLTVRENVLIAGHATRRGTGEAIEHALALCQLDDIADVRVSQVSAGRRRLVALARGIAGNPLLLLLDEPGAGLDGHDSTYLARLLRQLVGEGLGILLIDHNMSLVLEVCDRVAVLNGGVKIAEGAPAEVRADAAVVAAYLGEAR